jgi:hypothetical protein
MVLLCSPRMPLMTSCCFTLHARSPLEVSKISQYSSTSLQRWLQWQTAKIVVVAFKGCSCLLHSMNRPMNSTVFPLQRTTPSTHTLEAGQSRASTKYTLKFPYSNQVSHLVHMKGHGSTVITTTTHWMDPSHLELMTLHFLSQFAHSLTQYWRSGSLLVLWVILWR